MRVKITSEERKEIGKKDKKVVEALNRTLLYFCFRNVFNVKKEEHFGNDLLEFFGWTESERR